MVLPSTYHHHHLLLFVVAANLIRCSDAFFIIPPPPHSSSSSIVAISTTSSRSCGGGYSKTTSLSTSTDDSLDEEGDDNDDDNSAGEIFYDDFSGPIGDVVGVQSSDDASSQEIISPSLSSAAAALLQSNNDQDEELLPDFQDNDNYNIEKETAATSYYNQKEERELFSIPLPTTIQSQPQDITGSTYREFTLGRDLLLSDYAGSLGFDQVTDWQYYTTDISTGQQENRVANPFDPSQPSRTRSKSGSVVRIFRGEFTGKLGGMLRSRGLDTRVLLKEFAVDNNNDNNDDDRMLLLNLANGEQKSLAKILSSWLKGYCVTANNNSERMLEQLESGEWTEAARRRYVDGLTDTPTTKDDDHLATLLECLSSKKAPFTSILGTLNLNDYYDDEDMNPNDWYKSLGVKPPVPGSIWVVYDYHGLSTAASYAVPLIIQQSKLPPKRGMFGNIVQAPPLPPFRERGRYMIRGVLKGMLQSIATAHAANLVHRSIGKNSFILSSVGQDKREATNPYAVVVERLRVVLSDWGFSRDIQEAVLEKEFSGRCRMFGIPSLDSYEYQRASDTTRMEDAAAQFAMAEDLHACGFVFLSMLFTTLADPATLSAPLPATDDDTLQRLFSEIFEKDVDELREYYANEDVWSAVVSLLDMEERAGWDLLGKMLLAREEVSDWYKNDSDEENNVELTSAQYLLSHPFFQMKLI